MRKYILPCLLVENVLFVQEHIRFFKMSICNCSKKKTTQILQWRIFILFERAKGKTHPYTERQTEAERNLPSFGLLYKCLQ